MVKLPVQVEPDTVPEQVHVASAPGSTIASMTTPRGMSREKPCEAIGDDDCTGIEWVCCVNGLDRRLECLRSQGPLFI